MIRLSSLYLLCLSSMTDRAIASFDQMGVAAENEGIYVGDEKFPILNENGEIEDFRFCSRILESEEKNNSRIYLTAEGSCKDVGIDQVSGMVVGDWFQQISLPFLFIEEVDGWECLPTSECIDVISDRDESDPVTFSGYDVTASSCGRQLKREVSNELPWSCDTWQVNLLHKKETARRGLKTGKAAMAHDEYLVVITVTYSNSFATREESVSQCPSRAVYKSQDILDSEFGVGAIQFVVQQGIGNITDPCTWDCYEDESGVCA